MSSRVCVWIVFGLSLHLAILPSALISSPAEADAKARIYFDLPFGAEVDASLQAQLQKVDQQILSQLDIHPKHRAIGLLVLKPKMQLAWIRADQIFYGASVPKICILLAYFEKLNAEGKTLDDSTRRELELMIKRSDNDFAQKYSKIVGIENVQKVQTSPRYRFYDAQAGGGLWSGKHYGLPAPRTTEPVGGFSHSFTVRQALRFYLLLEQGRLVSPEYSRQMQEIFRAPDLEFHDDNFIKGLRGRDVIAYRKNGLWEDWHLDTARVEKNGIVYLIAGAVNHEKGGEYLQQIARSIDEIVNGKPRILRGHHRTQFLSGAKDMKLGTVTHGEVSKKVDGVILKNLQPSNSLRGPAEYVTPVLTTELSFNEVLPSWNVSVEGGAGCTFELRVSRLGEKEWSPYLYVGDWRLGGKKKEAWFEPPKVLKTADGKILTDFFSSKKRHNRFQLRVRAYAPVGSPNARVIVHRLTACFSDVTGLPLAKKLNNPRPRPNKSWQKRLKVPFRSQRVEKAEIAGRICSPTSVNMVLAYQGFVRSTQEVADLLYDRDHDIYGNWPRAVQGAFSFGVKGYLARFSHWDAVEASIADGQPLIISIRVREGELQGAPYKSTAGHLLVVTGFDAQGNVHVNDPAGSNAKKGMLTYSRKDLERVWMGLGGTAYVIGR